MPEYKKTRNHLYLKLKGHGRDIHLKIDKNKEEYAEWKEALLGLTKHYKDKQIFPYLDDRTDYKAEVDIRIKTMIMEEQESTQL